MRRTLSTIVLAAFVLTSYSAYAQAPVSESRIETGDMLEIVVLGEEELERTVMVMHDGTVSFPLIGEVTIAGLTIAAAIDTLAGRLQEYYAHPVVSIVRKSPVQPYVSVFGEVARQGAVEYQRGLRVTDYIALAGGPSSTANLNKVKVVRFIEGTPRTTFINVASILAGKDAEKNYELKSGDWIQVGKRFTINWSFMLQLATLGLSAATLYLTIQNAK